MSDRSDAIAVAVELSERLVGVRIGQQSVTPIANAIEALLTRRRSVPPREDFADLLERQRAHERQVCAAERERVLAAFAETLAEMDEESSTGRYWAGRIRALMSELRRGE